MLCGATSCTGSGDNSGLGSTHSLPCGVVGCVGELHTAVRMCVTLQQDARLAVHETQVARVRGMAGGPLDGLSVYRHGIG